MRVCSKNKAFLKLIRFLVIGVFLFQQDSVFALAPKSAFVDKEPELVKGVYDVSFDPSIEPEGEKQIKIYGINHGNNTKVREAIYIGNPYWAKYEITAMRENEYIAPQIKILNRLKQANVKGVLLPAHYLEVDIATLRGYDDSWVRKVILFEKLPQGETLKSKIDREGETPEEVAIPLMLKILKIFADMHNAGVYHWDIKPENIWITKDNEVIVFDFDLAFRTEKEFVERKLNEVGDRCYLSANRWKWTDGYKTGSENFPPIKDETYSLGLSLLEMLRGTVHIVKPKKFYNTGPLELLNKAKYKYKISKGLREILLKALANGVSQYETVEEFTRDLEEHNIKLAKVGGKPVAALLGKEPCDSSREYRRHGPDLGEQLIGMNFGDKRYAKSEYRNQQSRDDRPGEFHLGNGGGPLTIHGLVDAVDMMGLLIANYVIKNGVELIEPAAKPVDFDVPKKLDDEVGNAA